MKHAMFASAVLTVVLCAGTAGYTQSQGTDLAKREFARSCAFCHGLDAKGSGPYTPYLKTTPPDLTVLAKKNGGVFPTERVHQVIDGRAQIGAHGPRDMPVWGARYLAAMAELRPYVGADVPADPEAYIRARILMLIDYLHHIQQ
jgi:mono/diheme cytochrome c family protein